VGLIFSRLFETDFLFRAIPGVKTPGYFRVVPSGLQRWVQPQFYRVVYRLVDFFMNRGNQAFLPPGSFSQTGCLPLRAGWRNLLTDVRTSGHHFE
jgi:hypothetical protein